MGACGSKSASKNFQGEGQTLSAPKQQQGQGQQHPIPAAPTAGAPVRQSQGYRLGGEKVVDPEKQVQATSPPGSPVAAGGGDGGAGVNASDPEERAKRLAAIEQRKQKDRYANKQVKSRVFGGEGRE